LGCRLIAVSFPAPRRSIQPVRLQERTDLKAFLLSSAPRPASPRMSSNVLRSHLLWWTILRGLRQLSGLSPLLHRLEVEHGQYRRWLKTHNDAHKNSKLAAAWPRAESGDAGKRVLTRAAAGKGSPYNLPV
jgi:hypothetical protein